ncbi:MAG TPA: hypothetical protein VFZ65_15330 [Planctomycetota bacterium]|nr:hypothetical protein [Planctomycetota bacterium]
MHQTPFQKILWMIAKAAHAAGDRADARILMGMIVAIDEGDYAGLTQMTVALRATYRSLLGPVPSDRVSDVGGAAQEG